MGLIKKPRQTPRLFYADQFDNPVNSDWTVNALAPASADNTNAGVVIRAFDDTLEEGVGFALTLPLNASFMKFTFKHKANTAPGGAKDVLTKLYRRTAPDNAAVAAWSAAFSFTPLPIPTNVNFQYDDQTVSFTTLGLTPNTLVQFELTRADAGRGTKLVGDWNLAELMVEFF